MASRPVRRRPGEGRDPETPAAPNGAPDDSEPSNGLPEIGAPLRCRAWFWVPASAGTTASAGVGTPRSVAMGPTRGWPVIDSHPIPRRPGEGRDPETPPAPKWSARRFGTIERLTGNRRTPSVPSVVLGPGLRRDDGVGRCRNTSKRGEGADSRMAGHGQPPHPPSSRRRPGPEPPAAPNGARGDSEPSNGLPEIAAPLRCRPWFWSRPPPGRRVGRDVGTLRSVARGPTRGWPVIASRPIHVVPAKAGTQKRLRPHMKRGDSEPSNGFPESGAPLRRRAWFWVPASAGTTRRAGAPHPVAFRTGGCGPSARRS